MIETVGASTDIYEGLFRSRVRSPAVVISRACSRVLGNHFAGLSGSTTSV